MTDRDLTVFLRNVGRMLLDDMDRRERFEFSLTVHHGLEAVEVRYGKATRDILATALSEYARGKLEAAFRAVFGGASMRPVDNPRFN